ncbi:MAG: 2-polyprenylphenol 6-hydroxylase [Rhodospirillales bacterium]|nr:2-polyprenylphenol 6-hydroxylase [Rhodospirillales bacterium]
MIRDLRNGIRLCGLAWTLARHDALFVFERFRAVKPLVSFATLLTPRRPGRPGQRLAKALQDAGPSFIKFGQTLASRSDLVGDELSRDLAELQDRLPPFPFEQVRATILEEFGRPLDDLYASFDPTPVAAASISQVHFAVDREGREAAVKVLRPGIEKAFARDLDLFLWIGELIETHVPALRRLRAVEAVGMLADSVAVEMDLRFEAAASAELAENFVGDRTFHVPVVDWTRTGKRVLTIERVSGIKIDERDALIAAGHDPLKVLTRAAEAFFHQVFRDGFFHADMHAGNLFVRADGSIAAVDFGIMGRLDRKTRRHLAQLLLAFLSRDFRLAARVHFAAGWIPADRSIDAFAQACRSIAEPILDRQQNEISVASLLGQLFQITETFSMELQPQLLLLQKTMLVAEGTGRKVEPEANMWFLARPLIEAWTIENLGPQGRLRDAAEETVGIIQQVPALIHRVDRIVSLLADSASTINPEFLQRSSPPRAGVSGWIVAAFLAAILLGMLIR